MFKNYKLSSFIHSFPQRFEFSNATSTIVNQCLEKEPREGNFSRRKTKASEVLLVPKDCQQGCSKDGLTIEHSVRPIIALCCCLARQSCILYVTAIESCIQCQRFAFYQKTIGKYILSIFFEVDLLHTLK